MAVKYIPFESNPIKREMYSHGYTRMVEDYVNCKMLLINDTNRYVKSIDLRDYMIHISSLSYYEGSNLTGNKITFISEQNESASKFRELIKPE